MRARDRKALGLANGSACRVCGCTQDYACAGGCWWVRVEPDSRPLCSSCAGTAGDLAEVMLRIWYLLPAAGATARAIVKAALLRMHSRQRKFAAPMARQRKTK